MPTIQGAFPLRQDSFLVGQPVKSRYNADFGVCVLPAGIGFGQPVARGAVTTPAFPSGAINDSLTLMATGLTFLGIARRDQGRAAVDGGLFARGAPMAYFKSGEGVAVLADKAIAATDVQVRWNSATGRYTDAAASGTVFDCTGWTFDSITTAAGQLVVIKR